VAGVEGEVAQAVPGGAHAVGAGENDPVEGRQLHEMAVDLGHSSSVGGASSIVGAFEDLGAQFRQMFGKLAGLLAGARDEDFLAEEGALLEPVERGPQRHDLADEGDGGGLDAGLLDGLDDGGERAGDGLLIGARAPADDGGGVWGSLPAAISRCAISGRDLIPM